MTDFSFNLSDFVLVWWGLLYEALPFVVVGAILSGLLECCVSSETVARLFPKNRVLGIGLSACIGLLFPLCECGIVPIVRRLVLKGVTLMGLPLPKEWLGGLKNVDLIEELSGGGGFLGIFFSGLEQFRVEDGELTLRVKE